MTRQWQKFTLKFIDIVLDDNQAGEVISRLHDYDYATILSYQNLDRSNEMRVKAKPNVKIPLAGKTVAEVLQSFDPTVRKHIRKTYKVENLRFKPANPDFASGYKLYCQFEKAQKRKPLAPAAVVHCVRFHAYLDKTLISGIWCTLAPPILRIHSLFSQRLSVTEKKIYKLISLASRRLVLEACQFAITNKCQFMDLGSINKKEPAKVGINEFKMSFHPVEATEYHHIYESRRFTALKKIRQFFLPLIGQFK